MIQDAYLQLIEEAGFLVMIFMAGFLTMGFVVIELIRKTKTRRSIGEIRRQKRAHAADHAPERAAHASEVDLLQAQIKNQNDGPKPFESLAKVEIERCKLMNRGEVGLYRQLKPLVEEAGLLIWPQVPLGEVLRLVPSAGTEAERRCVNRLIQQKRLDFAITDKRGLIVAGLEYQGHGHLQGNAAWRDHIKREVFRIAGIRFVEFSPQDNPETVRERVLQAIRPGATAPGRTSDEISREPEFQTAAPA
ncbi:DUF2726 domain-containing protein [Jannaschia ovalis]|uniref:DUF2726 domain-containing protein n=1 Tax=Jannaschia ovalis TaxID=3038773 RepID=A0ABY8LDW7_9RHOB|nr:DUF2726 domain-containing protein [Jannaschia sp. GRR-S6-38]WGH79351.1 DUF2726 domain-containing protein [Jannaschia sp. GRR-S6-38]